MNVIEALKAAREVISDEKNWTTDAYAKDANGDVIGPMDETATCWCASGALLKVTGGYGVPDEAVRLRHAAKKEIRTTMGLGIVTINDCRGHAAIINAFDKTIARLEANS